MQINKRRRQLLSCNNLHNNATIGNPLTAYTKTVNAAGCWISIPWGKLLTCTAAQGQALNTS